jgi:hypothetical protein
MEWVASGQVIQFASVMVLLIVVASLGILHILEKEGIGTLLGAIAGYVLSQGVGRAATRAATREHSQGKDRPQEGRVGQSIVRQGRSQTRPQIAPVPGQDRRELRGLRP